MPISPTIARGIELDREGLRWIDRFGYLRARELAGYVYSRDDKNAGTYTARQVAKWLKHKYVIERKLPGTAGRCFVLAQRGADMLADVGIIAKSGKDIGALDDKWMPPRDWRHHILATAAIAILRHDYDDAEIVTERELKRNPGTVKLHDGLIKTYNHNNPFYIAIEVEMSRKTGEEMLKLAQSIIANEMCAKQYNELTIDSTIVVCDKSARDERGHALDHKSRTINAIKERHALHDVRITFMQCDLLNYGICKYDYSQVTVESTAVTHKLKDVEWQQLGADLVTEDLNGFSEARISKNDFGRFAYELQTERENIQSDRDYGTPTAAQRAVISYSLRKQHS